MWSYKVVFEIPYDRPERLRRRLVVDAPIRADALLGGGEPPGARLQRRLRRPPELTALDRAATALYLTWEAEPHAALAWILARRPGHYGLAATRLGTTFAATLVGYALVPSAPPWWASEREGRMGRTVRRVTDEVLRELRGRPRPGIAHGHGANPWAAMPSDHFASAVATAAVLAEAGARGLAAAAAAYALALGAVLVYTGEHYVVDLAAGLLVAAGAYAAGDALAGPVDRLGEALAPKG